MQIKYVDDKKTNGILYDWNLVRKEYKKLKCPKGLFNVGDLPLDSAKWFLNMSVRANTGKTTASLLWLLCTHKVYGTIGAYIRQREMQITPKFTKDLFSVILEFGYIEKLYEGKYNTVIYKARRWYLAKQDEDGNIEEQETEPFMIMLAISNHLDYKSSLNYFKLDIAIIDEFISEVFLIDEFIMLCDLISTCFRAKINNSIILMLANNIDRHSPYFRELDIYDDVQTLNFGDSKIITSPLGTKVYVGMISMGEVQKKMKDSQTRLLFGFNNPKLSAITGQFTWAVKNYPHIPKDINYKNEVITNRYIRHNGNLIRMRIILDDNIGTMLLLQRATKLYDNAIIYTREEIHSKYERKNLGYTRTDSFIWNLYKLGRAYFSTNDIGSLVDNYLKECSEYTSFIK